jgi:hypothetical protein
MFRQNAGCMEREFIRGPFPICMRVYQKAGGLNGAAYSADDLRSMAL